MIIRLMSLGNSCFKSNQQNLRETLNVMLKAEQQRNLDDSIDGL